VSRAWLCSVVLVAKDILHNFLFTPARLEECHGRSPKRLCKQLHLLIVAANQEGIQFNQIFFFKIGLYSRAESTKRLEVFTKPKGIDLLVRNSTYFLAHHPGLENLPSI